VFECSAERRRTNSVRIAAEALAMFDQIMEFDEYYE
jgi:hypothetical protein